MAAVYLRNACQKKNVRWYVSVPICRESGKVNFARELSDLAKATGLWFRLGAMLSCISAVYVLHLSYEKPDRATS